MCTNCYARGIALRSRGLYKRKLQEIVSGVYIKRLKQTSQDTTSGADTGQANGCEIVAGTALIGGPTGVGHASPGSAAMTLPQSVPAPAALTSDSHAANDVQLSPLPRQPAKKHKLAGLRPGGMGIDREAEAARAQSRQEAGSQAQVVPDEQEVLPSGRPPESAPTG